MFDMLSPIVIWIEGHETTVDLLKWILLLIAAWLSGLFRFIRSLSRQPKVRVDSVTSRCYIEDISEEKEARPNSIRAAFLLEIEVVNLRNEPISVNALEIQVHKRRLLFRWTTPISAISLPNRVTHEMGHGIKILKNWFSRFSDNMDHLTLDGRIGPKDAESAYALFVSSTWGSWNPLIFKNHANVCAIVHLATGEKLKTFASIPVTTDADFFEKMVPGILNQIRHPTAWNAPGKSKSKNLLNN